MLPSECVVSFILRLICPCLDALSVLKVVLPLTLILGPVHVHVDTGSVGFVIGPETIIDVTVDMDELTLAMGTVLPPVTDVFGAIRRSLLAEAVSEAALPLPAIDSARGELVGVFADARLVRVVLVLSHCLAGLNLREVLAAAQLLGSEQGDKLPCVDSAPPGLNFHN